ncbi:MAG: hypothetical protein M0C28_47925 [Candidatus Moduliflexus flocculans]|nr:hypothetical protein [Candidatus Moduliflexus flocculans]
MAKAEKENPDLAAVTALFHDAGKFSRRPLSRRQEARGGGGARLARKILEESGLGMADIGHVVRALRSLYQSGAGRNRLADIVHDADFLSKSGYLGRGQFLRQVDPPRPQPRVRGHGLPEPGADLRGRPAGQHAHGRGPPAGGQEVGRRPALLPVLPGRAQRSPRPRPPRPRGRRPRAGSAGPQGQGLARRCPCRLRRAAAASGRPPCGPTRASSARSSRPRSAAPPAAKSADGVVLPARDGLTALPRRVCEKISGPVILAAVAGPRRLALALGLRPRTPAVRRGRRDRGQDLRGIPARTTAARRRVARPRHRHGLRRRSPGSRTRTSGACLTSERPDPLPHLSRSSRAPEAVKADPGAGRGDRRPALRPATNGSSSSAPRPVRISWPAASKQLRDARRRLRSGHRQPRFHPLFRLLGEGRPFDRTPDSLPQTCFCPVCLAGFEKDDGRSRPGGARRRRPTRPTGSSRRHAGGMDGLEVPDASPGPSNACPPRPARPSPAVRVNLHAVPWRRRRLRRGRPRPWPARTWPGSLRSSTSSRPWPTTTWSGATPAWVHAVVADYRARRTGQPRPAPASRSSEAYVEAEARRRGVPGRPGTKP